MRKDLKVKKQHGQIEYQEKLRGENDLLQKKKQPSNK